MPKFMQHKNALKYFAYIRKSSDREDAQTLSIEAQTGNLKEFAKNANLDVVKFFVESASAYKIGRPKFNEMLERIQRGEASGILVYHLTRIARNSFDGGRVIYLMDEGLIQEIRTPEKAYSDIIGDDKFMMQIHFAMAKKSSDDTSQFVKRDIQSKLLKGEYPLSAPLGYLNLDRFGRITGIRYDNEKQVLLERMAAEENRKLRRVEPDPILAPILEKVFSLYSTGAYSLNDVRRKSFELGLRGQRNDTMLSKATLQRIFSNPLYYGAMQWGNKIYQPEDLPRETAHKPIVDKVLFQKVQDILHNKSKPRKQVHHHAYTCLMRCGECGSMITAELQKGIVYYRCTKKKREFNIKCSQPYIREKDLEAQMQEELQAHVIPKDFIQWALETLNRNNDSEDQKTRAVLTQQRKQVSQVEVQLSHLLKLKISPSNANNDLLSDEEYLAQKNALLKEKQVLQEKVADTEQHVSNWLERCEQFFDFAVDIEEKWIHGTPEERKLIFTIIFGSNATLKDKKLYIEAKRPFFRTVKLANSDNWRGRPGSNRRPSA